MRSELQMIRDRIDRIDDEIVRLLSERMECSAEVSRHKSRVRDQLRELEVLERLRSMASGRIDPAHVESVYRRIMAASVDHQMKLAEAPATDPGPSEKPFAEERAVVLGAGSMGGWFARELALECPTAAYDTDPGKLKECSGVMPLSSAREAADFEPSLILNAVTLTETRRAFDEVLPHITGDCLLADIMSIKGDIQQFYRKAGRPFVSLHPMFGPRFTDMLDLSLENAILIEESDLRGAGMFTGFLRSRGISVYKVDFDRHDAQMAQALTLPFAASMVFAASLQGDTVSGTTFSRHRLMARRLLLEDDRLIAEVLFNPHSREVLNTICGSLEYLKHIMAARDQELASDFLNDLRRRVDDDGS